MLLGQSAMCSVRRMAKRTLKEFKEVSEVSSTSLNGRIQDVLTALSPMKKSKTCSFFNGAWQIYGYGCFSRQPCAFFASLAAAPLSHTHRSHHGLHGVVATFRLSVFASVFKSPSSSPLSLHFSAILTSRQ